MSHEDLDVSELREVLHALNTLSERLSVANPASSAQIHVSMGGITNGLAIGCSIVSGVLLFLGAIWVMFTMASMRQEISTTRQDLQDQQAAWVAVMQSKIAEAKNADRK